MRAVVIGFFLFLVASVSKAQDGPSCHIGCHYYWDGFRCVISADSVPSQLVYCRSLPDSFRLQVYNRWGDCLIDSRDSLDFFDFNILKAGVDVKAKHSDQDFVFPFDSYVYVMKAWQEGKLQEYTGTFVIERKINK